ncbi:MAG: ankyrin repeat domain-containing protein [Candidatus Desantisbacteria bacterium]
MKALKAIRKGSLALVCLFVFVVCGCSAGNKEELLDVAEKGDISTVKALLAKGAEVNAKSNDGVTALMAASQNDHIDVVKALKRDRAKK